MSSYYSIEEIKKVIDQNHLMSVIWGGGYLGQNWGLDYLKKWGIEVAYFCDSNSNLWGTTIHEKTVLSIDELEKRKNDVFVFVIMGNLASLEVHDILDKMGIKRKVLYTELLHMKEIMYDFFPYMEKPRIAVYTCVTNDYDDIVEHEYISDKWDMFIISDNPGKEYKGYTCLDISDYIPPEITDFTRQNRFCKLHPHKIFPQYRYSIYFDANTYFVSDFSDVIETLPKTRMAVASKLFVDDIYEEAMRIMNARRDNPDTIAYQMRDYWLQGMPSRFGQYWNYILVREHNNPTCISLMEQWWEEYEKYSKRDQMSLPYVVWKNGYLFNDVGIIDGENRYWKRISNHKRGESRV